MKSTPPPLFRSRLPLLPRFKQATRNSLLQRVRPQRGGHEQPVRRKRAGFGWGTGKVVDAVMKREAWKPPDEYAVGEGSRSSSPAMVGRGQRAAIRWRAPLVKTHGFQRGDLRRQAGRDRRRGRRARGKAGDVDAFGDLSRHMGDQNLAVRDLVYETGTPLPKETPVRRPLRSGARARRRLLSIAGTHYDGRHVDEHPTLK